MLRKLLVNALALIAVLAVAGGAMAAAGRNDDGVTRPDQEVLDSADGAEDIDDTPGAEAKGKAKAGRQADDTADDDRAEQSVTADDDSFGAARSAEVAEYQACRDAAVEDGDDCEKPGPAWQSDAHPVFGTDGDKAGETPGASAAAQGQDRREEAAAQRPERGADSDVDDEDDAVRGAGRSNAAEAGSHGKGRAKAGR